MFTRGLIAKEKSIPEKTDEYSNIPLMPLPYSLAKLPLSYYEKKPQNIEIALSLIKNSSDISMVLLPAIVGPFLIIEYIHVYKNFFPTFC